MKVYIKGIVFGVVSILLALFVVGIPPVMIGDFHLGWTLGLTVGIVGIVLCRRNREKAKTTAGLVLSIIGVVCSVANMAMSAAVALGLM